MSEVQRQNDAARVGARQLGLPTRQIHELLKPQTGAPHGEVVALLVCLRKHTFSNQAVPSSLCNTATGWLMFHLNGQLKEDFGGSLVPGGDDADPSARIQDPVSH